MRRIVLSAVVVLIASVTLLDASRRAYESGVVGLVVTRQEWNEDRPWAKMNPFTRRAAGTVIEGPYILTTAQMIADATYIQIEKFGKPGPWEPRVVQVDPAADLALLAVDDPAFYADLGPVRIAAETPTEGDLRTVRWNAQQLESVVSRVKRFEVQDTYLGRLQHPFLLVQTDMSGGGWAEPVFAGDRLVGLTVSQNEQRARVIPAEVIGAYLRRVREGPGYGGFPVLGVKWQVNEDPSLSRFLGQTGGPRGVLVRQVPWGSSGCGVLEPRDILLSIDGIEIDAGGYYTHPRLGQLQFTNIVVEGHEVGDVVPVRVLRDGREIGLPMTLRGYPVGLDLVPEQRVGEPPPYVVAGGLVFRELDGNYLRSWGSDWSKKAPLGLVTRYYLQQEAQSPGKRRVVLLASVLPSPYNVGYQNLRDLPVESINGFPIGSIPDVVEAFGHPQDGYHVVVLEPNTDRREIVLDAASLEDETAAVLEAYRVPAPVRLPEGPPPDAGPECPGAF